MSPAWASSVGAGTTVTWPVAAAGESGCSGSLCRGFVERTGLALAAHVLAVPGSIAFSALVEATQSAAGVATIVNPAKQAVAPSWVSALAAGDGLSLLTAPVGSDLANPVCSLASSAYPFVYLERIHIRKTPRTGGPGCSDLALLSEFLVWISTAEASITRVRAAGFSPLPPQLLTAVKTTLQQTACNQSPSRPLMAADAVTATAAPATLEIVATSTLGVAPLKLLAATYVRE